MLLQSVKVLAIGLVQRGISAQVYEGASGWTDGGAGANVRRSVLISTKYLPNAHQDKDRRIKKPHTWIIKWGWRVKS